MLAATSMLRGSAISTASILCRQRLAAAARTPISRLHTSIITRAVVTDRDLPLSEELHNNKANNASEMTKKDPQLGDYPNLPFENLQNRRYDPAWWDPQEKRNFGETLHEQDDVLGVWAPDVHSVSPGRALRHFMYAVGAACTFAGLVYLTFPGRPSQPRQYPRDGLLSELGGVAGTAAPVEGAFDKEGGDDDEEGKDEDEG